MRSIWAGAAAVALVATGVVGAAPSASATTTWTYPGATFTLDGVLGYGSFTVSVTNLALTPGGSTTGYVRVDGRNNSGRNDWCSTTIFSGTSAQWSSPSLSNPCRGSIDFSVDPTTGVLSASTGFFDMSSIGVLAQGTASGSATAQQPSVGALQGCALTYSAADKALVVRWSGDPAAASYVIAVSGDGTFTGPPTTADPTSGLGALEVPIEFLSLGPITPGADLAFTVDITATRSDGATVATCTTSPATVPGPAAPTIIGKPVAVTAGGLLTVNYDVPNSPFVQGIEYRLDGGPWLRPGGQAPVGGVGGTFTLSGIAAKQVALTLRTVTTDAKVTVEGTPTTMTFPGSPSGKPPASSGVATGSTPTAPVAVPPTQPTSVVTGTSNGAGTGTNGALAANTGDAGIDAPCLAEDGTLYPALYSTVGSQLTMAPNTRGLGSATSFTVVSGALPAGLQLDRRYGVLYGVTTRAGSWTTTVRARFADGSTKDGEFTTRVDADPQTLQYSAQNIGSVGTPISIAATTNAPVTGTAYTLVCGALPAGTRLDARTGRILGTPTAVVARPVPLRIAETSSAGSAAASFIVVVDQASTHRLSYPAHPHAHPGKRIAIRPTLSGVGDVVEYRTSIGKLPRGLRLNHATGVITGRPAHVGRTRTITLVAETRSGALLTAAPMRLSIRR